METCGALSPYKIPGNPCIRDRGHAVDVMHRDEFGAHWGVTSQQPDRAAQVEEIQARIALGQQLSSAGFTREELTEAAAKQVRLAPTKDEILTAILEVDEHRHNSFGAGRAAAAAAVKKLFEERGL